jgi:hypothetical protein
MWLNSLRGFLARMPRHQKITWAGIACLTLLALYVSWKNTWHIAGGSSGERPMGYAPLAHHRFG